MRRLKFSKSTCIGCMLCAMTCSAMHEGEFSISKARIGIKSYYDRGKELIFDDAYCTMCGICARKCPQGAITAEEKLALDTLKCIGCGTCARICPKKVIKMHEQKPLLCDTCDGSPKCVSVCPHGALTYA